MNGGTSLRSEGVINRLAASNILESLGFVGRAPRPAVAVFGGFGAAKPGDTPARYQVAGAGAMAGALVGRARLDTT
jgi:hypothetical protein